MLPALIDSPQPQLLWLGLMLVLMGVNLLTYTAFLLDKSRARRGQWRVSERGLLVLAATGGWPAAKLAQHQLHHKLHKRTFTTRLNLVGLMLGVAATILLTPIGAGLVA